MARTPASVAASRIAIEDEVWEEAFASRVPSRRRRATGSVRPARPTTARSDADTPVLRIVEPPVDTAAAPEARRTVRIQGRGADPYRSGPYGVTQTPRRSSPMARSLGANPDRLAMWAAMLGFLLVVVALLSSHF